MTNLIANVLVGAALLAVAAFVGRAIWVQWRRTFAGRDPVLMHRMLERQGVRVAEAEDYWTLEQAARAARRCVACRDTDQCQAFLDRGATDGYEDFCPNAAFIKTLKAQQAAAAPRPMVRAS
jgi:hypothetical protein